MNSHGYEHLCGWKGIDPIQKRVASLFHTLRRAAPQLFASAPVHHVDPILLYNAYTHVLGTFPAYTAQTIGDCTGFGHGHAIDLLQCIEIGLGANMVFRETDTEFLYAAGRQVAGILAEDDGGYGAAVVKAMTSVGMVSRATLGPVDGVYSGLRAKSWGATGPPPEVVAVAKGFKLGMGAMVKTWDELVAAIDNGYPTSTCTSQGFTLVRDADGFCRAEGEWGHCMFFSGVRFDRPGACVMQSWGEAVPSGPLALGQPPWSFWADRPVVESMLGEGDSWALSKTPAFYPRELPATWRYSAAA